MPEKAEPCESVWFETEIAQRGELPAIVNHAPLAKHGLVGQTVPA